MKLITAVVLLTLLTSIPASCHVFLVVDYVPHESQCGTLLYQILEENFPRFELYYDTTFIERDFPDLVFFITGVQSYNQGDYLPEEELQAMREYLSSEGDAFVFGLSNILFLTPEDYLGLGMITQDPQPTESLWCDYSGTVFENMVFVYDESEYYGAYYMMPWQSSSEQNICLLAEYGMSGSPRGVQFEDSVTERKAITLNMDLTLVTDEGNTAEELVMTAVVDYFGYDPTYVPDEDNQLPKRWKLYQNYPNPFNNRTAIAFTLPEECEISLEIYDILGRKVEMLINDKLPVGHHSINWDAGNYASGIYFYRLHTSDFNVTRRMSLIK